MPVERAAAFLWYVEGSQWREAIHRFKYGNMWRTAYNLGRWYGAYLKQSGLYDDVDAVVPVPLHWWRRLTRGYNQSEYLADGIAKCLGAKVERRAIYRSRYNRTQTSRSHSERWQNVEGIFAVRNAERLQGRHILLVDDVFTTGATIMSLGETILAAAPDARLSVATLAATPRSLNRKD
jgi:ComF family protein